MRHVLILTLLILLTPTALATNAEDWDIWGQGNPAASNGSGFNGATNVLGISANQKYFFAVAPTGNVDLSFNTNSTIIFTVSCASGVINPNPTLTTWNFVLEYQQAAGGGVTGCYTVVSFTPTFAASVKLVVGSAPGRLNPPPPESASGATIWNTREFGVHGVFNSGETTNGILFVPTSQITESSALAGETSISSTAFTWNRIHTSNNIFTLRSCGGSITIDQAFWGRGFKLDGANGQDGKVIEKTSLQVQAFNPGASADTRLTLIYSTSVDYNVTSPVLGFATIDFIAVAATGTVDITIDWKAGTATSSNTNAIQIEDFEITKYPNLAFVSDTTTVYQLYKLTDAETGEPKTTYMQPRFVNGCVGGSPDGSVYFGSVVQTSFEVLQTAQATTGFQGRIYNHTLSSTRQNVPGVFYGFFRQDVGRAGTIENPISVSGGGITGFSEGFPTECVGAFPPGPSTYCYTTWRVGSLGTTPPYNTTQSYVVSVDTRNTEDYVYTGKLTNGQPASTPHFKLLELAPATGLTQYLGLYQAFSPNGLNTEVHTQWRDSVTLLPIDGAVVNVKVPCFEGEHGPLTGGASIIYECGSDTRRTIFGVTSGGGWFNFTGDDLAPLSTLKVLDVNAALNPTYTSTFGQISISGPGIFFVNGTLTPKPTSADATFGQFTVAATPCPGVYRVPAQANITIVPSTLERILYAATFKQQSNGGLLLWTNVIQLQSTNSANYLYQYPVGRATTSTAVGINDLGSYVLAVSDGDKNVLLTCAFVIRSESVFPEQVTLSSNALSSIRSQLTAALQEAKNVEEQEGQNVRAKSFIRDAAEFAYDSRFTIPHMYLILIFALILGVIVGGFSRVGR